LNLQPEHEAPQRGIDLGDEPAARLLAGRLHIILAAQL